MPKRSTQAGYLAELLTQWAGVVVTVEWEGTGVGRGDWWVRWTDGPAAPPVRAQTATLARWVRPLDVTALRWGRSYTPRAWALAMADVADADPELTDWRELAGLAEGYLVEADWLERTHDQAALAAADELAARADGSELTMARLLLADRVDHTPAVTEASDETRCGVCGAAVPVAATGRPARWCSPACRQTAYRRRLAVAKPSDETRCGVCGAAVPVAATGRPARWCSPACRTRAWRARTRT